MAFIGNQPTAVPLTSSQLADGLITTDKLAASAVTSAKILDSTIVNADIASTTINLTQKVTGTLPVANGGTGLAAIGTSLQVLRTNTGATALEYATISTGAAAGQVIQVLGATDSTQRSTTSLSYVTASNTLSVSITPSSASNKILILVSTPMDAGNDTGAITIFRNSTNLGTDGGLTSVQADKGNLPGSMLFLDSPSTTSAITYQVYMKATGSGSGSMLIQGGGLATKPTASIVCMEIKG
jgi:hypothetical protein